MAFGIQNNLPSIKAKNKTNLNLSGVKKSAEKLSSGLQINRAADNASGLAVSEKMRSQIRGLSQATKNVNDGISLIQTAEGGLKETHDILHRMRELSVQASNGTYDDTDREAIQLEVNALKSEINRISESTEYNGIPLLSGETVLGLESDKMQNEYGALYGSINYNLRIGGGKIVVTSQIHDMFLQFTTNASGKGGENAIYEYDYEKTQGDLTQHVTINLVAGQTYTDKEIQDLINNATVPKNFEVPPGKITFTSEFGFIQGANDRTYGLITGTTRQEYSIDGKDLRKESQKEQPVTRTRYFTRYPSILWDNKDPASTPGPVSANKSGTVHLNKDCEYSAAEIRQALFDAGYFDSKEIDHNGKPLNAGGRVNVYSYNPATIKNPNTYLSFSCSEKYEKQITEHYPVINLIARANQFGSYEEYKEDEIKYRQPDCIGDFNRKAINGISLEVSSSLDKDFECSVADDKVTVRVREGTNIDSTLANRVQNFLRGRGYNYTVSCEYLFDENAKSDSDNTKVYSCTAKAGSSTGNLVEKGQRFVKKVGTIAGERAVFEAELDSLVGENENPILHSSDHITFTANSYSSGSHCDSLVNDFSIVIDAEEGEESASVEYITPMMEKPADPNDPDGEKILVPTGEPPVKTAIIHLSTGVRYPEKKIESLLKDAGLNYSVSLTDKADPDAADDGYVQFINTGDTGVRQTGSGKGAGIEDIADITDKLVFQIGANGTKDQQVSLKLEDAGAAKLGVDGIDVSTVDKANDAISKIDEAVKKISMQRAALGSLQNRLEHTMSNITNAGEKLTDAESVIRDTDMAKEMTHYAKNNILQQISQAIYAQTNQMPEGILQLLQ